MTITLSPKAQRLLKVRLKSGRYGSAEEVLLAGLASLTRQERMGEFAPGELQRLVDEGEDSIRREGTVDADEVFESLRQRGARHAPRQRRRAPPREPQVRRVVFDAQARRDLDDRSEQTAPAPAQPPRRMPPAQRPTNAGPQQDRRAGRTRWDARLQRSRLF